MAALIIVNFDVEDQEGLSAYREQAGPILRGEFGATGVVRTSETLDLGEGHGAGSNTVVLRFDSKEAALEAWNSKAYQAALPMRLAATKQKFAMIVETLPDA